ncbi:MAG: YcaQ family DNA glycosylase [Planctomycetes bacterium]|nr:YcaQ family DNA glycosylase [Planctomycetota bacterium]
MPAAAGNETVSYKDARHLLLDAQGLCLNHNKKVTPSLLMKLIDQLGYVQIDTINVLERAHHLTLFSRLPAYDRKVLQQLLEKRRTVFEHWTHDASIIPSKWFCYWKLRFLRYEKKIRGNNWWKQRMGDKPDLAIKHVLKRIKAEGPLMARDFENVAKGQSGSWWQWKPSKAALEFLWHTGKLLVNKRKYFHKEYDLPHRVLPDAVICKPKPNAREHLDWACREAIVRMVIATPTEIAAFFNAVKPDIVKTWCQSALKRGEIIEVEVEAADGTKPIKSFAPPDWKKRLTKAKPIPDGIRLLNPFDPVLRDRKRAKRLFNFDYRFEAFVPAAKRIYGYYVLTILEGDKLIGRIDPKLHRDRGELEIKGLWWEPKIKATKARQAELTNAVQSLATFVGAKNIAWPKQNH